MKRFVEHGDHSEKENHRKMRILRLVCHAMVNKVNFLVRFNN